MDEKCNTKNWLDNYIYFTIYLDQEGDNININKNIIVSYSHMNADEKRKIIKLFNDHLPKHFHWDGINTHVIIINYNKLDYVPEINLDKIKDNDVYPELYISIDMVQNNLLNVGIDHLNVIKTINKLFPENYIEPKYGMNTISINVYSIEQKDMEQIYPSLLEVLDNAKEDVDTSQRINKYKLYYYLDGNTKVDLD